MQTNNPYQLNNIAADNLENNKSLTLANLLKAKKELPRDALINHNLEIYKNFYSIDYELPYNNIYLNSLESLILFSFINIIFLWTFFKKRSLTKYLVLVICLASMLYPAYNYSTLKYTKIAVIQQDSEGKAFNTEDATKITDFIEGDIVKIQFFDDNSGWSRVEFNRFQSWIKNNNLILL